MSDYLLDSLTDSLKLLPFLLLTYIAMEALEHTSGQTLQNKIRQADKSGPLLGGIIGIFPQCGFSAAASSLYAGRIISVGTLMAIFLSTSDEMLPIFLSEEISIQRIIKILAIKCTIAILSGYFIELAYLKFLKKHLPDMDIHHVCEHEHCHCEDGVLLSAFKHTLKIFAFIFIFSFLLNVILGTVGEETISGLFSNLPVVGPLIAALIGLIPNCASSVMITQLFLSGVITSGTMMSGLLVNAGVGLLVLFKLNDHHKENLTIVGVLYLVGVFWGVILDLAGIVL